MLPRSSRQSCPPAVSISAGHLNFCLTRLPAKIKQTKDSKLAAYIYLNLFTHKLFKLEGSLANQTAKLDVVTLQ